MNTCGNCQHYGTAPTKGPICTKTGKEVSFLQAGKSCWVERTSGPEVVTKVCNRCHRTLPVSDFARNHTTKDGYQHQCKECQREMNRAYLAKKATAPAPEPLPERTTKVCPKCGRELPLDKFGKNKRTTDGLKCYCQDCENANCRAYRAKRREAKKAAKEAAKKETPTPKPTPKPAKKDITLEEAIAVLVSRGYTITISKPQ